MKRKRTQQKRHHETKPDTPQEAILTFRQHLWELRRRLIYIVLSIGIWSIATYVVEKQTVNALLKPAKHQQFIYTSPIGGVDFMFRVSLYIAFILTVPVIVYNVLAFLQPLLTHSSRRFIAFGAMASGVLAVCGLAFGYFIGLPSAMHFLLRQFVSSQIKPLLTIQSYLAFVMVYMVGSALMLQIPLILLFINRIKPLKPKRLLHYERWVILGSFVMSAIMDPTPNVLDLLIVAGPLILMYQIGILIIVFINRKQYSHQLSTVPEPRPVALSQYAKPTQPAILQQFAGLQQVATPAPRAAALTPRPIQTVTRPSAGRSFDVVSRRPAARPTSPRPVFGIDQQLYIRRIWEENATA